MKTQTGTRIKKYTTLSELEKSTIGSVYVINDSVEPMEGNIIISIPKTNGNGVDLAKVPKTFIPIDLTEQVSRTQLMGSSEFRKTVGKGLIKLVTVEYAELLLSQDASKDEQKRLIAEANKTKNILSKAGVVDQEETEDDEDDGYIEVADIKKEARKASEKKSASKKPSAKIETLVATAAEEGSTAKDIIAKLRNVRRMTTADLSYLSKQYTTKPKIIAYLKERLAEMREEAAARA